MEVVKENSSEMVANDTVEEIIKPHQKQPHEQAADNNVQQQHEKKNHQLNVMPETKEEEKVAETAVEQKQGPQIVHYEEHDDYDEDDDEKETSQKLVIDIPEDDEEEKEDDEEDDDVIAIDNLTEELPVKSENEKITLQPEKVETIITLSDGEDVTSNEAASKPGKIQKRRSMGAAATNEKEQFRLKRRKINAAGAPKLPQTGYLRFLNDRRESMRKEHPSKTHMEHNKMIGEEWHALATDVKSSYLKAADMDKQRYVKELHSFLKSRPDILASELAKDKVRKTGENSSSPNPSAVAAATSTVAKTTLKDKAQTNENSKNSKDNSKDKANKEAVAIPSTSQQAVEKSGKRRRTPTPPTSNTTAHTTNAPLVVGPSTSTSTSSIVNCTPTEIPIFTNEFLEHNKIYDMELRSLRKSKTDLEQQNSVLEKHVENMKFGVEKMITENNELEEKNRLLEIYLDKLKRKLAMALSTLPLPTAPNGATVHNIDKYMQDLYKMSTSNSTGPATLNKAKDIIRKLDLQIHF